MPVLLPSSFTATGEGGTSSRWWEELDDPQLNELIESALSENWSLRSAWDRLEQAEALARKQGATRYPTLDATGSAARSATRAERPGGGRDTTYANRYSAGLDVAYLVDIWGKLKARRDSASLAAEATEQDVQATALALVSRTATTWYAYVEQREQLKLLQHQLASNEASLELLEARRRTGRVSATDVLQQRQLVESVRTELVTARGNAASLSHQLAVLVGGVPGRLEPPPSTGFPELPPLPATGVPAEWAARRPDLRAGALRIEASDRDVAAALADRYPSLTLTGSGASSVPDLSDLLKDWTVSLGGALAAPLFDGGQRRAEIDRTEAVLAERVHTYAATVLTALREVEDALVGERTQRERLDGIEKQVELARRSREQIKDKYRNSTVSFLEVLSADRSVQSLERSQLAARRALIEQRIALYAALGRGLDGLRPSSTQ